MHHRHLKYSLSSPVRSWAQKPQFSGPCYSHQPLRVLRSHYSQLSCFFSFPVTVGYFSQSFIPKYHWGSVPKYPDVSWKWTLESDVQNIETCSRITLFFPHKKKLKSYSIQCQYRLQNHYALNHDIALLENQIFLISPWDGRFCFSPSLLLFSYFTLCLLISETLSFVAFSGEWMFRCSNAAWCLDQSLNQTKPLHLTFMRLLI